MSQAETSSTQSPYIPASQSLPELTIKALVLSVILTAILAASNCYLALKVGTTIAASIPASVISIGILRFFRRSNILESTMVQTAASAGEGVASSISFVLPAMIMLKIWSHFPYWQTVIITIIGGVLGVFFSIPLRRLLLGLPSLRFPEGTAIGRVLLSCAEGGNSLKSITWGGIVGALVAFCQAGLQIFSDAWQVWIPMGRTIMGVGIGFNPALLAAGYIIGIEVGLSLLVGVVIGWVILMPLLLVNYGFHVDASHSTYDVVMAMWSSHLRFIGVGVMFVGGLWTLVRLMKPLINGFSSSGRSSATMTADGLKLRTERDIPFVWNILGIAACMVALYFFMTQLVAGSHAGISLFSQQVLVVLVLCLVLFLGFMLSTVCGYFAGLVGSTNNPLSGILIIGVAVIGLIFVILKSLFMSHAHVMHLLGVLIVITAVIATSATITNENIQDLKAGQIMGATPWKQQVVLMLGVICTSFLVAPVLELLFQAYGMAGVYPHAGMDPTQMLPAPQASLIASVAKGILTGELPWAMIFIGMGIAVLLIIVDEYLKPRGHRLPVLAVGLAIYLPMDIMSPVIIGSIVSYCVNHKIRTHHGLASLEDYHHQNGTLLACGLVAGAAVMGVILAIPFVIMGSSSAIAVMPSSLGWLAILLSVIVLLSICRWLYKESL